MAIQNVSDLDLGTFLQIIYSQGIYSQISEDYSDWEMIKMNNLKIAPGREYNFQLLTDLAPASTQRRDPGQANRAFPTGHRVGHEEFSAKFKEIQTTIEVDGQLLERASQTPQKYAEVWATQANYSLIGAKRVMAQELYMDGSGVLGHVGSSTGTAAGRVTITLATDRASNKISHAGWFLLGDIITAKAFSVAATLEASDSANTPGTNYKVVDVDHLAQTVELQALNADFSSDTTTDRSVAGNRPADDEVFFRYDQQVFPNLTSTTAFDYGTVATPITGLESLAAKDGRNVHGIPMEGVYAGTEVNANGQSIDVKFLEQALNKAKIRTGPGIYDWKKLCTSYQTRSSLIESKETDRRFVSSSDNERGSQTFKYIHGDTNLEIYTSEFIPEDAAWILPEVRSSKQKVLEYSGDEMKVAKYGNMSDFHFKTLNGGGYADVVQQFMRGVNVLVCKHPAAIASIKGFTNQ